MSPAHMRRAAPRRRSWPQRIVVTLGVLVVLVCLTGAGTAAYFGYQLTRITRYDDVDVEAAVSGEPVNYLIVGSDSRENIADDDPDASVMLSEESGGKRSDTIMVLRIEPDEEAASLLSFPRDLLVPLAGGLGENRINAAYGHGRQVLIDTIKQNFGIEINHYVEIDFLAFRDIVDQIGGVPLYFEQPVRDRKTGLSVTSPGCHVLDGQEALHFARSRSLQHQGENGKWTSDPTADLGRITRQQVFIRRALSKALSSGMSNPARLNGMLSAVLPKIGVDESIEISDMVSLARRFEDFDAEHLQTFSLPTTSGRERGMAIERLVEAEAEPILNIFRGLAPGTLSPGSVELRVLNGTGTDGQAGKVSEALAEIGFEVGTPSTADEHHARTTVRFGAGAEAAAVLVARHVTGGADVVEAPELGAGEVVLVTGDNLTTLHTEPAPEGSVTVQSSTSTSSTTTVPRSTVADTASTVAPATTTTTAVGYTTGEPPPGVACD